MSVHVVPSGPVGRSKLSALLSGALTPPPPRPADRVLEQRFWQPAEGSVVDEEPSVRDSFEPLPERRGHVVSLRQGARRP